MNKSILIYTIAEAYIPDHMIVISVNSAGADPGFLERGIIYIKELEFALLILSHFP